MAKGNEIIVSANPRGVFLEGIIDTAEKPGTIMQRKNVALSGGRFTYQVYNPADGDGSKPKSALAVLLPDQLQGKTAEDAYTAGARGFLYVPAAGEQLNVLWKNITGTGTGDETNIGDPLTVDAGTGKVILASGSSESPTAANLKISPFSALEALTDVTADTLLWVEYTGY